MTVRFGRGSSAILFLLVMVASADGIFNCIDECDCSGIEIKCRNTGLQNIPSFKDIKGANIIDLSENDIEEIDYDELNWKGIEQLQYIFLNCNSIVYVNDDAFNELRNLEYLDLSNNNLDFLPSRIFENNHRLSTLNLAGNYFGIHAPKLVSPSIARLDLSFCKLKEFSSTYTSNLPKLEYLNLEANTLKYFPVTEFKNIQFEINLRYNTWACNCSTIDLYNWSKNKTIGIEDPIMCMTKSNSFINLFEKAKQYLQKETCVIDPDKFEPSMKKYSQVKNATKPTNQQISPSSNTSTIILVSTITFIIIAAVSTTIGYILILYVHKRSKTNEQQGSEHLLMEGQWV